MSAGGQGFSPFLQGQRSSILGDIRGQGDIDARRLQSRVAQSSLSLGRPTSLVAGDVARAQTQRAQVEGSQIAGLRQGFLNQDLQGLMSLGQLAGGITAFATGNPLLGASLLGGGAGGIGSLFGRGSKEAGADALEATKQSALERVSRGQDAAAAKKLEGQARPVQGPPGPASGQQSALQRMPDAQLEALAAGQFDIGTLLALLFGGSGDGRITVG